MTIRTIILVSGAALGLAGCASTSSTTSPAPAQTAAPAPAPAAGTSTAKFSPFGVSGAGLIANRPVDLTAKPAGNATTFRPAGKSVVASAAPTTSTPPAPKEAQAVAFTPRPAPQNEAAPVPTQFYGQVMAQGMNPASSDEAMARGGGVNVVQVSFATEGADFDPSITRDGTKIIYASTQHRPTADIYVKDVAGRTVTQLTTDPGNDIMPSVSPDGTRIAFTSNRTGTWNIYVMPIDGGRAIQITSTSADDLHPSWSPDGTQIVFSRLGHMSGQWEMWITDVGTTSVAKFIGYGLFPEWAPATGTGPQGGDLIAFQRSRERGDRSFGIWTIELKNGQAGNSTEIASSPVAAAINPTWSPDGQWLAFATVPNAAAWAANTEDRPPQSDLWMVDVAGQSRINLTSGLALNLMPQFGPNNRLFFVSDRGGIDNIWSMDTTAVVQLAALNMKGGSGSAVAKKSTREATTPTTPRTKPAPVQAAKPDHAEKVADVPEQEHTEPGSEH